MAPGELVQKFLSRLSEARLCMEQGLADGTADVIKEILAEIQRDDFPQSVREEIRSRAETILFGISEHSGTERIQHEEGFQATNPAQFYNYGLALMDGQFWEEAIQELSMAAGSRVRAAQILGALRGLRLQPGQVGGCIPFL